MTPARRTRAKLDLAAAKLLPGGVVSQEGEVEELDDDLDVGILDWGGESSPVSVGILGLSDDGHDGRVLGEALASNMIPEKKYRYFESKEQMYE